MALEWIKITCDLPEKWQVLALRRALKVRTTYEVVGMLVKLWAHFENHTTSGKLPGVVADDIDRLVGKKGFAAALVAVQWLVCREGGGVEIPAFDSYMGAASRAREASAERMRKSRENRENTGEQDRNEREDEPQQPQNAPATEPQPNRNRTATQEREKERESKAPPSADDAGAAVLPFTLPPAAPHSRAVAFFCTSWEARYKAKYPFNRGKDGAHVKAVLAACDGDVSRFEAVVSRYLADEDPFIADKRHQLGMLQSQLPKWLVPGAPQRGKPGDRASQYALETLLDIAEG